MRAALPSKSRAHWLRELLVCRVDAVSDTVFSRRRDMTRQTRGTEVVGSLPGREGDEMAHLGRCPVGYIPESSVPDGRSS